MDSSKVVPGQRELEAIYSASRKADLGADQHERLRGMAQSVMAVLEKTAEKSNDEKGEGKPDSRDNG